MSTVSMFDGVALKYDAGRLRTPPIVALILCGVLGRRPKRVLDLGSGTGLSTSVWVSEADEVIGVEPNKEMREFADEQFAGARNVRFVAGDSFDTGLPDNSVDIVVASNALHWMDPQGTLPEVSRILARDGVMAGVGEDGCPLVDPGLEKAYASVVRAAHRVREDRSLWNALPNWPLHVYLEVIKASGYFDYCREVFFQSDFEGDSSRFLAWVMSVGTVRGVLREGIAEEEIGLPSLRAMAEGVLKTAKTWRVSYRMIIAKKGVGA